MLRSPYTQYNRLFVYYFDRLDIPSLSDDPDHIGTWIEDDRAIVFFHQPKDALVRSICRRTGADIIYQAEIDYRDWEAGTAIKTFSTTALEIQPVWERTDSSADIERSLIILDPSVIFGSGFHATTRLCLETLERLMLESGERIDSVLDLGTGTGLLAIAAAKLGAKKVTAVDNNPLACAVASRNVELNDCQSTLTVREADLLAGFSDRGKYDLVIGNLYKGLLLRLIEKKEFWQSRLYLLSGFMTGMEGDLMAGLPAEDLQVLHRTGREKWRLWLLKNKGPGAADDD